MTADETLDCYGLLCPMPIVETAKKISEMKIDEVLEILSTDEGIKADMPAWCDATGNEFLGIEGEGRDLHVFVKKTAE